MKMTITRESRVVRTAASVSLCLLIGAAVAYAAPGVQHTTAGGPWAERSAQAWLDALNISNTPEADSAAPALVVNSSGPHLVWEENGELYHSHLEGSSWTTPSSVTTGEQPSLAVGAGETLHLVFVNEFDGSYNIYYVRWDGSGWSALPRKVSDTGSFSDSPDLSMTTDGQLHVVWSEAGQIYHGESTDGILWPYAAIADGAAPSICAQAPDGVQVAWQVEEATGYDDVYVSELDGGGWSEARNVSSSPGSDSTASDVMAQTSGTPHLVWQEMVSATAQVRYSRGPIWAQPITLSNGGSGAYLPVLAVDLWGGRHVAWESIEGLSYHIRYTYAPATDATWTSPTTLARGESPADILEEVSLYAGPDGAIHAAWVAGESSRGEIFYARTQVHHIYLPLTLRHADT